MAVKYLNLSDKDYKKYKVKIFKKHPIIRNQKPRQPKIKKDIKPKKDEIKTVKSPFLYALHRMFTHGFKIFLLVIIGIILAGIASYYGILEDIRKAVTKSISANSGLVVNTEFTKASVFLDDNSLGETPINVKNLPSGSHILKIKPVDSKEGLLEHQLEFPILLEENRITVVKAQIGPTNRTSSYSVVYSKPKINDKSPDLIIKVTPKDANIYIDGKLKSKAPLNLSNLSEGVHRIKIEAQNYRTYEIEINHIKDDTIYIDAKLYRYILPNLTQIQNETQ